MMRALERATQWHEGQTRDSGEPFVNHPIAVAEYLAGLEAGRDTLVAALLHDVVEDERADLKQVEEEFGGAVAKLVDGVTKLSKLWYEGKRDERQIASLRKMLLTANDDLRVIVIKLADRWHNIETIGGLQGDKRARVALETLDIYVPFARLMGLWHLKIRFEEVCFPIALPKEYQEWHAAIEQVRTRLSDERRAFVERVNAETSNEVETTLELMTDYEIYQKLHGSIKRIQDEQSIDSIRIVVRGRDATFVECYRVLGELHHAYPVSFGTFRDYISNRQPNGYQALHTTIFLAQNHLVRLRIQTEQMEEYASRRKLSSWMLDRENDVYRALSGLHLGGNGNGNGNAAESANYMRDLRDTVLKERINVFTTSGDIFTLPYNATGVDFAYAVNPGDLSYMSGIKINGELKEPTHTLREGDTVEVVVLFNGAEDMRSSWVDKVKSVEAREQLQKDLQKSPHDEQVETGTILMLDECRKRRLPHWWLFHVKALQQQLCKRVESPSFDAMLADVGTGLLSISTVVDAYALLLAAPPSFGIRLMQMLHLLPRQRVLNRKAALFNIEVYALDRKGLIHDITRCFAERDINIAKFGVFAIPPSGALYKIRLEANNFEEFSQLYDSILQVPNVTKVLRKK